jgi:WD40-like Beta Propeller Repeat
MRKIVVAWIIPILWIVANQPAKAFQQIGNDPLVMNLRGDLWSWNGSDQPLQQLTSWGFNEKPVLSPNGQWVAYRSYARITVDWLRTIKGGSCDCDFPTNIWLLNTQTGETSRAVDQPADASYKGPDDDSGNYRLRSDPVWSPDGQSLAWTEFVPYPGSKVPDRAVNGRVQLVVFDLASKTSRVIVARIKDVRNGGGFPIEVKWGEVGLTVLNFTPYMTSTEENLLVYSPSGKLLAHNAAEHPILGFWLKYREKSYLCCGWRQDNSTAYLIDPLTGENVGLPGVPELYSLTAPEGISVYPDKGKWQISRPGEPPVVLEEPFDLYHFQPHFVISRDGKRMAYIKEPDQNTHGTGYPLLVYNGTQAAQVATVGNDTVLAWGPVGLRIRSIPIPK